MDRTGPLLDPSLLLQRQLLSKKIGGPAGLMGPGSLVGAPSQSLYEMAALTHEMDTQAVTTKVKEILLANNIGQKVSIFNFWKRYRDSENAYLLWKIQVLNDPF